MSNPRCACAPRVNKMTEFERAQSQTTPNHQLVVRMRDKIALAYRDLIRSLCVPWGLRMSQRMPCIDYRMLSYSS